MSIIKLQVLTDAGLFLEDQATSVIAPGQIGYFGVLNRHAPLVTTIQPGKLTWRRSDGQSKTLHVGAGLFEVASNCCTLLTDSVSEPAPA